MKNPKFFVPQYHFFAMDLCEVVCGECESVNSERSVHVMFACLNQVNREIAVRPTGLCAGEKQGIFDDCFRSRTGQSVGCRFPANHACPAVFSFLVRFGQIFPLFSSDKNPKNQLVLNLLCEAAELARLHEKNVWQFAITFDHLEKRGVTRIDLEGLVEQGLIQCAVETTENLATGRTFSNAKQQKQSIHRYSSFVLARPGLRHLQQWNLANPDAVKNRRLVPDWCSCSKQLRIAGQLVKHFRWRAENQRAVLAAFQKANWPTRIKDPLPPDDSVSSTTRLHDTIKCLNRRHPRMLMRFHGDGTGEGVVWRLAVPPKKTDVAVESSSEHADRARS